MSSDTAPFVSFSVAPEFLDESGLWNPREGEPPLEAAFQFNVFGTREHYLQLAEFSARLPRRTPPATEISTTTSRDFSATTARCGCM
jgi:hypothetical protein